MRNRKFDVGSINKNNYGTEMKIIEYNTYDDIVIEFQDEYKYKVRNTCNNFIKGDIKNPYDRTVYGIGYFGVGDYSWLSDQRIYDAWKDMLRRCYDPYKLNENRYAEYRDCFVCDSWKNFQNFAKWYDENYYEVPNESMQVDKDILNNGSKLYSPETCLIVPKRINQLFIGVNLIKDDGLPIGCSINKRVKEPYIMVTCRCGDERYISKTHYKLDQVEQAFLDYKKVKEKYIQQIATKYAAYLPSKVYRSLMGYKLKMK